MKVQYFGHSCFLIETNGFKLLFDPFITPNSLASNINIENISCDYILISHGHQDHLYDAESIAKRTNALIISNYEIVEWFKLKGVNGIGLNLGGSIELDFGTLKYVIAIHSSVLPDGTYGGNPGGFVISNEEGAFYFAGDTALTRDMKLIPMTCPSLSFSILPIGSHFTMDYKDALVAAQFLECDTIVGCHYDTMPVIKLDHEIAIQHFNNNSKELILIPIGESIDLF
ncbi:MAG: metal-dependent hydrolase [Saprospiraceae bacterium]|nr:metal-dependent hydrolase [Saprospiraceae bacterium]